MSIHYSLQANNLTSDPDDYTARVRPIGTAELDQIIDRMIQQGSTVTKADTLSVLEEYFTTVENMILEGLNVNTPLANFGTSIRGNFQGREDGYNSSRHQIKARVNAGKRLRQAIVQRAQVVKEESNKPIPNPLTYTDVASETHNSTLTPGGMGQVTGYRLKVNEANVNQGVFFVDGSGGEVRATVYARNKPAELIFMVPEALAAGNYTLQVRASFAGDGVRSGALPDTLTVAS